MRQPGLQAPSSINRLMAKYGVNVPNVAEIIWQPIYDYQVCAAAATNTQLFFQVPQGQAGKTANDTNMTLAGQIPAGQRFLITGIEIDFTPGVTIGAAAANTLFLEDVFDFYRQGNIVLTIGSKPYLTQGPLMKFPPTNRLGGFAAAATGNAVDQAYTYALACGNEFQVRGLVLQSSQDFRVEIQNRLALPSTNAGRVGVRLNGFNIRQAQ